ncbi:MAG TPA: hypothetical protein VLC30_00210 [Pseudomonas sp.]|nr:hypothetical protein [Pseudomonas sp.]
MRALATCLTLTSLLTLAACDGGTSAALQAEQAKQAQQQMQQLKQQIDDANAKSQARLEQLDEQSQ